ncbi:MAG TPA: HmuY family protein [Bacteroidales bacterium]|nr:HmuY family protein [Bacteroidales bacterium]
MKNVLILLTLFSFAIIFQGCFEKDEKVPPQVPGDASDVALQNSIYDYQVYFDFGTNEIRAVHLNNSWVLAFDASADGWDISVNSGNLYGVAPTGVDDFDSVTALTSAELYRFDAADGNPDSSAFSNWIDRSVVPWKPTGEIFLVGQYDGIKYSPVWKIRIDSMTEKSYKVTYSGMESKPSTAVINKNYNMNFVHVTFDGDSLKPVNIEPPKTDWDILFSQYGTILYTDDGLPTPYFVRGVLLNPFNVQAALVDNQPFDSIDYDIAQALRYSEKRDLIGHDWKYPVIDFDANTAVYYIRKDSSWIVKDTDGLYYKMHFLSYYSYGSDTTDVEKGYPEFVFQEL